jgi:hypothetical protein
MVSLTKKTKVKSHPDFKDPKKSKLGKPKAKNPSETQTKVTVKRISMPKQSILVSTDELQDIFNRCRHFNAKKRIEAMADLRKSIESLSNSSMHEFVSILCVCICDDETGVRKAVKEIVLNNPTLNWSPYKTMITVSFRAGLSHVETAIRTDTATLLSSVPSIGDILDRENSIEIVKILAERKSLDLLSMQIIFKILELCTIRNSDPKQWTIKSISSYKQDKNTVDKGLLQTIRDKVNSNFSKQQHHAHQSQATNKIIQALKNMLVTHGMEPEKDTLVTNTPLVTKTANRSRNSFALLADGEDDTDSNHNSE